MNKLLVKYLPFISVGFIVLFVAAFVLWLKGPNGNSSGPDLIETPPAVNKINSLPLAQRPFVSLVPHANAARCDGLDLQITNLKNNESKAEYELEYNSDQIRGLIGMRDLLDTSADHAPLELGTCSAGKCSCDQNITGGSLRLDFMGAEAYSLKSDFSMSQVGADGIITSRDVRLNLDVSNSLSASDEVLIMNTFGYPGELQDKVLQGPYGIYVEGMPELDAPIVATLQSKDVSSGKIQFWNGQNWSTLPADIEGDVATFTFNELGVIVLTE